MLHSLVKRYDWYGLKPRLSLRFLKTHLDESLPTRPISILNFISKILERLFLQRIQPHILASSNYNQHQSAYRPGHSTETALVHLLDSIYHAADHGKATLLFSLDLSAAFDTIDHSLLLRTLSHSFGFTGSAIMWVQSYFTGRSQTVRLGSHCTPWCSSGLCPGPTLICHLYFSYLPHCWISQYTTAPICRRLAC